MSRNKAENCRNEVKSYITREGMTMTEVVELLSDEHGWSSSVPNLSGKLRRGSLRYTEAVELADVKRRKVIERERRKRVAKTLHGTGCGFYIITVLLLYKSTYPKWLVQPEKMEGEINTNETIDKFPAGVRPFAVHDACCLRSGWSRGRSICTGQNRQHNGLALSG